MSRTIETRNAIIVYQNRDDRIGVSLDVTRYNNGGTYPGFCGDRREASVGEKDSTTRINGEQDVWIPEVTEN